MSQYFSGSSRLSLSTSLCLFFLYIFDFVIDLATMSVGGIVNSISILADSCRVFQTFPTLFKGFSFTFNLMCLQTNPIDLLIFVPPHCPCDSKRCCKVWIIILNLYIFFSLDHSAHNIGHQQTAKSWFPSWLRLFNRRVKCQGKTWVGG